MSEREFHLHRARIYLAQVPVFRARGVDQFHLTLLEWATKARKAAEEIPVSRDLFGDPT